MSDFRPPHDLSTNERDYPQEEQAEAIAKLVDNYENLLQDYNRLKAALDEEVFYHVIPMTKEEAVISIGTFTASHKKKVLIYGVEYYLSLDAV